MKLSVSIMGHPVRESLVHELQKSLNSNAPIAWDGEGAPNADKQRRWRTARKAWEMHDPEADFHCVLQDDGIVCDDFIPTLRQALRHMPRKGIVSTYWGEPWLNHPEFRKLFNQARMTRTPWIGLDVVRSGLCIIAPVDTISEMLESGDHDTESIYDARLQHYYCDTLGWPIWHTMPSLTDHRQAPSLIGHKDTEHRVAANFRADSGLKLTWDRPAITRRGMDAS